jgi:hypothetical protein
MSRIRLLKEEICKIKHRKTSLIKMIIFKKVNLRNWRYQITTMQETRWLLASLINSLISSYKNRNKMILSSIIKLFFSKLISSNKNKSLKYKKLNNKLYKIIIVIQKKKRKKFQIVVYFRKRTRSAQRIYQ